MFAQVPTVGMVMPGFVTFFCNVFLESCRR